MSGDEPATRQAQIALFDHLKGSVTLCSWHMDRSDTDPLDERELPGCIMRFIFDTALAADGASYRCTADVQFDFQSGEDAGLSIDAINQRAIAQTMKAVWAGMQPGGVLAPIFETLDPISIANTEQIVPDVGWAVLRYGGAFYIDRADPFLLLTI